MLIFLTLFTPMKVMQLYWCVVLVTVIWQASGQAPGDRDTFCRTGQGARRHIFPGDWELMFDSFDYTNLDSRWTVMDFDQNSGV